MATTNNRKKSAHAEKGMKLLERVKIVKPMQQNLARSTYNGSTTNHRNRMKITILAIQIRHESVRKQSTDIGTPTHYPIPVAQMANSSPLLVSRANFASCSFNVNQTRMME